MVVEFSTRVSNETHYSVCNSGSTPQCAGGLELLNSRWRNTRTPQPLSEAFPKLDFLTSSPPNLILESVPEDADGGCGRRRRAMPAFSCARCPRGSRGGRVRMRGGTGRRSAGDGYFSSFGLESGGGLIGSPIGFASLFFCSAASSGTTLGGPSGQFRRPDAPRPDAPAIDRREPKPRPRREGSVNP